MLPICRTNGAKSLCALKTLDDFKISNRELQTLIAGEAELFPKYVTQILNLANQNAGGTRPKIVAQMSELIQQFEGDSLEEWAQFYRELHPDSIEAATQKIEAVVENLKTATEKIDRPMIERWVSDLILVKTFVGLRFQSVILEKVAAQTNESFRLANTEEEARGIDGFIGERPISIKPDTYKVMVTLPENISVDLIFYCKTKDGLKIEADFLTH